MEEPYRDLLRRALRSDEPVAAVESLIAEQPRLPAFIGESWAGGFCPDNMTPAVARVLVAHGAPLTVHAAAALGFTDELERLLREDAALVHAKGGDGCTPLHFARDLATAQLLVERGADINARDDDHDSSPAQWRVGQAPDVTRYLLERGAAPDIFLAAALGDADLAGDLISQTPRCTSYRIGKLPEFPPIGFKGRGGSILQWTLAFNSYPHQIALLKGHHRLFDFLYEHSDAQTRLLVCCVLGRRQEAEVIHREHPEIVPSLASDDLELLPRYCWETNTNYEAVRLMLDLGFPVAHTESSHGYSPLHNAAWSGNAALVDLLISRGHPVNMVDPSYKSTPLGFAVHDCVVEKRHPEGEYAKVVESLLKAGSKVPESMYPTGDEAVDEVLARYRRA